MKISSLSNKIKSMERDILSYKQDATLINQLYYCGRGDVNLHVIDFSNHLYFKIAACQRLIWRYERKLDQLDGVVGENS